MKTEVELGKFQGSEWREFYEIVSHISSESKVPVAVGDDGALDLSVRRHLLSEQELETCMRELAAIENLANSVRARISTLTGRDLSDRNWADIKLSAWDYPSLPRQPFVSEARAQARQ